MYRPEDVAKCSNEVLFIPHAPGPGDYFSPFILTYICELDIITLFFRDKKTKTQRG